MNGKLLVFLTAAGLAYGAYSFHNRDIHARQFAPFPVPSGVASDQIIIAAAQNCPRPAAQYAAKLNEALQSQGIPSQIISQISFPVSDDASARNLGKTLENTPAPQVFINGQMMGAPTIDQILAQLPGRNGGNVSPAAK